MEEAVEASGTLSSTTLDLDEAEVVILDLQDDGLGVGICRPRDHRHGGLNEEHVLAEVGYPVGQHLAIARSWKKVEQDI